MGTYKDVLTVFGGPIIYRDRAIAYDENCLVSLPHALAPDITNEDAQTGQVVDDLFNHIHKLEIKNPILISLLNLRRDIRAFRNFKSIHTIIAPACKFKFGNCFYSLYDLDLLCRAADIRNIDTAVMLTNRPAKINLFMAGIIEFLIPAVLETEKKPEILQNVKKMDHSQTGARVDRPVENCIVW